MKIGIAISTVPSRKRVLENTIKQFKKVMPKNSTLVVTLDKDYLGISTNKNQGIESLMDAGCDQLFLFDDDTYPIADKWWEPYVYSPEPHLQYNFENAPDHWKIKKIAETDVVNAYDKSRGCMLYLDAKLIPIVGGMHNAFGRYGREHENLSMRIHNEGFTTHPFQDAKNSEQFIYCADQDTANITTAPDEGKGGWRFVDERALPVYAEYRNQYDVPVMVARRNDNGHRDRIWRHIKDKFWGRYDYKVYEGYHAEGPFNRSTGLNIASKLAGNWAVGIFADSDAYIDPLVLKEGIALAVKEQRVVLPFTEVHSVNRGTSLMMLDEGIFKYKFDRSEIESVRTEPLGTQSLIVIVPRNVYEQVHGFDQRCVGWGAEDNIFYKAAQIVSGEPLRISGNVYHIWHKVANKALSSRNVQRWRYYRMVTNRNQLERVRRRP